MKHLIASLLFYSYALATDIPSEFGASGIVPDIVFEIPSQLLTVRFKYNDNETNLQFGEELTPTMVKEAPTLSWLADDAVFYTVCMIDLDSPSSQDPSFREMLHWLLVNVPGSDLSRGEIIAEYVGSGPAEGTGLHRYVLLVYKQPNLLDVEMKRISNLEREGRPNFSIREFAGKFNLSEPIAGNMFRAQYDDYVPIIRKQMDEASEP